MKSDSKDNKPRFRSRLWRWTKRIFVGIAGLIVILAIAGAIYQFVATKQDESQYPPPTRFLQLKKTAAFRAKSRCI